ncbi:MAG: hypothetical protein DMG30_25430 [Acidobacteria bacterium]|nr:MAG: hypothetical protein DMG30_25430 [Acidobacteriota bacterium]
MSESLELQPHDERDVDKLNYVTVIKNVRMRKGKWQRFSAEQEQRMKDHRLGYEPNTKSVHFGRMGIRNRRESTGVKIVTLNAVSCLCLWDAMVQYSFGLQSLISVKQYHLHSSSSSLDVSHIARRYAVIRTNAGGKNLVEWAVESNSMLSLRSRCTQNQSWHK